MKETKQQQAARQVLRSIKLLDMHNDVPSHWRAYLVAQQERLRMASDCDCVLGIVFDPYLTDEDGEGYVIGLDVLQLADYEHPTYAFNVVRSQDQGRIMPGSLTFLEMEEEWRRWIAIWADELKEQGYTND